MDAQLSLIVANMARVSSGSLVYDPFAGTGSILVACAHYGGYVIGSDIDWTIVHGRGRSSRSTSQNQWRARDENVRSNLVQYSLDDRYIDMLVHDASCCIWSGHDIFDAIITDPPYGIREGLRKTNEDSQSIQ
jgi:tRNA (guanine10-N2)-methyltransferase